MRRLYLSLLMPLLMLLAQQGAAWHEIGHWSQQTQQQSHEPRKSDPADKLCESCLAFAQAAFAAAGQPPALALADAGHVQLHTRDSAALPADAPTARSRGPPLTV